MTPEQMVLHDPWPEPVETIVCPEGQLDIVWLSTYCLVATSVDAAGLATFVIRVLLTSTVPLPPGTITILPFAPPVMVTDPELAILSATAALIA
jgi:hypothetical protein